jgi:hypothetical protein
MVGCEVGGTVEAVMGYKASFVVASEREPDYLGTLPRHHPGWADTMAAELFPGRLYDDAGPATFEQAIYPDTLYIGAYEGAALVAEPTLRFEALRPDHPVTAALSRRFPTGGVLTVGLDNGNNYFAYAYFEGGHLLRAYAGDIDDTVTLERGEPLPEEEWLFASSIVRDRRRIFLVDGEEWEPDQMGTALVFSVASRFFGAGLDSVRYDKLILSRYNEPQRETNDLL